MAKASHTNGGASSPQENGGGEASPARVTRAASSAVVRLLSNWGVAASEVVVTRAEQRGTGEAACWSVCVLRGRQQGSYDFPIELVDKVLQRGPNKEWYSEVGHLLEAVGMTFPA